MTDTEMDKYLEGLRQGFDISIEKMLRDKAAKGLDVVLCTGPGDRPRLEPAKRVLEDFVKEKSAEAAAVLN